MCFTFNSRYHSFVKLWFHVIPNLSTNWPILCPPYGNNFGSTYSKSSHLPSFANHLRTRETMCAPLIDLCVATHRSINPAGVSFMRPNSHCKSMAAYHFPSRPIISQWRPIISFTKGNLKEGSERSEGPLKGSRTEWGVRAFLSGKLWVIDRVKRDLSTCRWPKVDKGGQVKINRTQVISYCKGWNYSQLSCRYVRPMLSSRYHQIYFKYNQSYHHTQPMCEI